MTVALTLADAGCDVLAIDGQRGKCTGYCGEGFLCCESRCEGTGESWSLWESRMWMWLVIAVAENMEASIIAAMQVKELGVPFVMAKAMNALHGRILEKIGADKVIYPEQSMGVSELPETFCPVDLSDTFEIVT